MNRREALLTMFGAVASPQFLNGAPFDLNLDMLRPLKCGWQSSPEARRAFVDKYEDAFISQLNQDIKGSGKGKKAFLWKNLERVLGKPYAPMTQTIGDCYTAGTLVTMADGSRKKIEKIKIGEKVVSHLGNPRTVTRTIRKSYSGRLITVEAKGYNERVTCTPDHLFWTQKGWVAAKSLRNKDSVFLQGYRGAPTAKVYDLLDFLPDAQAVDNKIRAKGSHKWCHRYIQLDEKLAWVLGAYLAEGGCSKATDTWQKVDFNLSHLEVEFGNKIAASIEEIFGVPCQQYSVPSKPTVRYVRCQSTAVATFFKELVPGNTYSKNVPTEIFTATEEVQLACIRGWLAGDGHFRIREPKTSKWPRLACSGVSVSKELIRGLFYSANNCQLNPRISKNSRYGTRAQAWTIDFATQAAMKLYPQMASKLAVTFPNYKKLKSSEYGLQRKIKKLSTISRAETTVYCLVVEEDHSFIANGYSTHNCVGDGFGLGVDVLGSTQIMMHNKPEIWGGCAATEIIYAGSRVEIGGENIKGDGSVGAWAAEFVKEYGTLQRKKYLDGLYDFTTYSGEKARKLGYVGVPDELEPLCKLHPVKTVALVESWEDARDCLYNGSPIAVCSNVGFQMGDRNSRGECMRGRRPWHHCMLIAGYVDDAKYPMGLIMNSWGNYLGGPRPYGIPEGSFFASASTINKMLSQGDSFALSAYIGFPRVDIPDYNLW